ncbi:MBL fold metallo-hydrolase [candidate division KSB1 bacterium]|nr:MBL fold metallo-hydrolase [candidate division KSB1 bacterium]
MASLEELREERIRKLNILRDKGINPYPSVSNRNSTIDIALRDFKNLSNSESSITLAGRILSLRAQGGLMFFNFNDGTGGLQAMMRKDDIGDEQFSLFDETVDIGDYVEVQGVLMETKRGEKTILARDWRMLAKSLRPLPDKWHGLTDIEERFRKRYLDILMSGEVRKRFETRSKIIKAARDFLEKSEYIEVETPVLQSLYGGASAEPFVTHHNALDIDLYLRAAKKVNMKIDYVIDTHVHADHISGGRKLAEKVGAKYVLYESSGAKYDYFAVSNNDVIELGNTTIKILHTPGHTPEHITLLVTDNKRGADPWFVCTGHTLMIGDMGRTTCNQSRSVVVGNI